MSRIPSLEGAMLALENGSQRVQSRGERRYEGAGCYILGRINEAANVTRKTQHPRAYLWTSRKIG